MAEPSSDEIADLMGQLVKTGSHRPATGNTRPPTPVRVRTESYGSTGSLFDVMPAPVQGLPVIPRRVEVQFPNVGMGRSAVENHFIIAQVRIQEARLLAVEGLSPEFKSSLIETAIRIVRDAMTHLEEELKRDGRSTATTATN